MKSYIARMIRLLVVMGLLIPSAPLKITPRTTSQLDVSKPNLPTPLIYLPFVIRSPEVLPPIIPETTKVLSDSTTQYLTSMSSSGVFTFTQNTTELSAIVPGEIIVSTPTVAAPDGFLRKVISLTPIGDEVILDTQPATLEDAIQQGSVHLYQVLSPDMVQHAEQLPGVSLEIPRGNMPQGQFHVKINDVVLYDKDGDPKTTNDIVKANGSITFTPSFTFDLVVQNRQLKQLHFVTDATDTSQLTIDSSATVSTQLLKKEIAQYPLTPFTVMVGPLPVVLTPILSVNVGLDGNIEVGVTTGVTQSASISAGVNYFNNAWDPIGSFSNQFQFISPTLFNNLGFKGYGGAELALMIYGIKGPQAEINAYLKLQSDIAKSPWWELYGGLEVPVGVEIEIFSRTIANFHVTVIDDNILLSQATTPPPSSEMAYIPAGEFQMGCYIISPMSCNSWEYPVHRVYLDAYFIDKYEVTNNQYAECVNDGVCSPPAFTSSNTRSSYFGNPDYANYPVIYVSWYQARDYCSFVGKRLPTEAEWEKAAVGSNGQRAWPWGDDTPDCTKVNSYDGYFYTGSDKYCIQDTNQVGSYPNGISPYGVYDMAGNVWEWVNDWFGASYYQVSPYNNPTGPSEGSEKVVRGGAWDSVWGDMRTTVRISNASPSRQYGTYGFRCAASP